MQIPRPNKTAGWAAPVFLALLGTIGLTVNLWMAAANGSGWGVDFNQFYSASRLAGTGQLYDWDALRKLEAQHGPEVHTGRLPIVAYGEKAISWLRYDTAHIVWTVASVAALILFAALWPGTNRLFIFVALCWSMPAALLVLLGQDTPFWLMFFACGLFLLQRGNERMAGILFALCICKFHLALGLPVLLIARKCWSTLIAGGLTAGALIWASFVIEGPGWPSRYLAVLRQPAFSPAPERMPNIRGLASWVPWSAAVEVFGALGLIALLWALCRRNTNWGMTGAAAAAVGLLLGHHGYANDCALLIPLQIFTVQRSGVPVWLKGLAFVLLTPVTPLLLASAVPLIGQLLIAAFVISAIYAGSLRRAN